MTEDLTLSEDVGRFAKLVQNAIDTTPDLADLAPIEHLTAVIRSAEEYKAMFDNAGTVPVKPIDTLVAMVVVAVRLDRAVRRDLPQLQSAMSAHH